MAERGTPTLTPPAAANGKRTATPGRTLTRRRSLPGSRAVVGGLLVTASAVGLFAAYGSANSGPSTSYVVTTRAIAEGEQLRAGDLATAPIDLPDAQRAITFAAGDLRALVGTVATAPLRPGTLLQETFVARAAEAGRAEVSVPVAPANAMNGVGLVGSFVDVVVSRTVSGEPVVEVVAERVEVVDKVEPGQSLGNSGELIIVLAVDPEDAPAVAGAAASGTVSLVRTDGLRR